MITKFLLNTILCHVGMSWIICSNNKMLYGIEENNNIYWFNKVPWYNTAICYKLHGEKLKILFQMQEQTDIISCVL